MKKHILILIFLIGTQHLLAQERTPLNKEQTLDYIEKLAKSSYKLKDFKISSVEIDGNNIAITFNDGEIIRKDLSLPYPLAISKKECGFSVHYENDSRDVIFVCLQLEDDAKRLKKALEHLIEILKTEKNFDPFAD